jgi:predicted nucleotidyltransferase
MLKRRSITPIDFEPVICNRKRMTLIDQHKDEIIQACRSCAVKELHVFGSVLSDHFTENSDVDFAVDFNRNSFEGSYGQFMEFKDRLEHILHRNIDLISIRSVRNPIFLRTLNNTKQCIYAA